MLQRHFTGLWRHAGFMRLWSGQTLSAFGSMIGGTAMDFTAILVLHATPFQLGLLYASRLVPGFLAGLFAGVWVDRLRRRPILIGVDIGRAVLLATIPLAAILGLLHMEQMYAVAFLVSILTIFFDVAYQTYLPSLISPAQLIEGNSKLSASASVAEFGGFAVAGWLVQLLTAPVTILIDAASFVVSAATIWMIRVQETLSAPDAQPDLRREIVEGLGWLLRHPLLRATAACLVSREFFGGMYGALVVLYMARDLGFATGILGMIWAVGGISSLIGASASEPVTRRLGIGRTMIGASLISTASSFLIPLAQGATLLSALLLIVPQMTGDGPATIYAINDVSLRRAIVPQRLLGRVNASVHFLRLGAMLAGTVLGGLLGGLIGVRATLFLGAGGALLSVLWLINSPVRTLHAAPEPQD